jgi:hypothetical protein
MDSMIKILLKIAKSVSKNVFHVQILPYVLLANDRTETYQTVVLVLNQINMNLFKISNA